jgi:hypothetical protein
MPRSAYDDDVIRAVVLYGDDERVPARTAKEWRRSWREHLHREQYDPDHAIPGTRVARVCAQVPDSSPGKPRSQRESLTTAEFRDRLAGILIEWLEYEREVYPTLRPRERHRLLLMLMDRYARIEKQLSETSQPGGLASLAAMLLSKPASEIA